MGHQREVASKNKDHLLKYKNMSPPPPKKLIYISLYQNLPGLHPGQIVPNGPIRRLKLEQGKEIVELVTGGRGWVKIDEEWIPVTPGALLWHVPGDETIARSDFENPYQCLVVPFEIHPYKGVRRAVRLAWWNDLEEVNKFARELLHLEMDERFDRQTLLLYSYSRLLFQSHLWQRAKEQSEIPPKLREALAWISSHVTESFSLNSVAEMVGWSMPHFHAVFREKMDMTPHQFILNLRMRIAKERLATTEQPIKEIATTCGFSNTAIFCHSFKTRIGVSPLRYRKQERGWMAD